jgi:hypothetical protein
MRVSDINSSERSSAVMGLSEQQLRQRHVEQVSEDRDGGRDEHGRSPDRMSVSSELMEEDSMSGSPVTATTTIGP